MSDAWLFVKCLAPYALAVLFLWGVMWLTDALDGKNAGIPIFPLPKATWPQVRVCGAPDWYVWFCQLDGKWNRHGVIALWRIRIYW